MLNFCLSEGFHQLLLQKRVCFDLGRIKFYVFEKRTKEFSVLAMFCLITNPKIYFIINKNLSIKD